MASFPSIQKPEDIKRKTLKPKYVDQSSAGYTMSFPKGTVPKKEFRVTHNRLSKGDRDTLDTFFISNSGVSFTWTDPEDDTTTYDVVFVGDDLEFQFSSPWYWTVTYKIREV